MNFCSPQATIHTARRLRLCGCASPPPPPLPTRSHSHLKKTASFALVLMPHLPFTPFQVVELPPGATNFATSRRCKVHGMMMMPGSSTPAPTPSPTTAEAAAAAASILTSSSEIKGAPAPGDPDPPAPSVLTFQVSKACYLVVLRVCSRPFLSFLVPIHAGYQPATFRRIVRLFRPRFAQLPCRNFLSHFLF